MSELSEATKQFFDAASSLPAIPNELRYEVDKAILPMEFYKNADQEVGNYASGNGRGLTKDRFLGLFGRLFALNTDGKTYCANTREDATNLVFQFITKFPLEAKGVRRVRKYRKMYVGFRTDACEWENDINNLHIRNAAMRKSVKPPHVIALIVTWLNMALIQSSLIEAQRIFLILHLMRFDFYLRKARERIVVVRHDVKGDDGEPRVLLTKINPEKRVLCVDLWKAGRGDNMDGVAIQLNDSDERSRTVTALDCCANLKLQERVSTVVEGPFDYSTASRVANTLLIALKGVFANDLMQSPQHMWQSFYGKLQINRRNTDQALLATRAATT